MLETLNLSFRELLKAAKPLNFSTIFGSFVASYDYVNPPISGTQLSNFLKSFKKKIETSYFSKSDFLNSVSGYFRKLNKMMRINSLILIDNLGIPEILFISKRFEIEYYLCLINPGGDTKTWKEAIRAKTMSEVARKFGMHLFNLSDKQIHYLELKIATSPVPNVEQLGNYVYYQITSSLLRFIKNFEKPVLIASDHGYDVVMVDNYFLLCHGFGCLKYGLTPIFSKLSMILIIS